jgi:hypothetical protein
MSARKSGAILRRWLKNLPPDIAALSAKERQKLPKNV